MTGLQSMSVNATLRQLSKGSIPSHYFEIARIVSRYLRLPLAIFFFGSHLSSFVSRLRFT
jgi:hypothetical protein